MTAPSSKKLPQHLSGAAIVTGDAKFIGEDNVPQGMLQIKAVFSSQAHAKIVRIDFDEASKIPGVVAIITPKDIPGENQIGHTLKDEPLLPTDEVMYIGQPILLIAAKTLQIAEQAVAAIKITYEPLPTILTIDEALAAKSFYVSDYEKKIERGDVVKGFREAAHVLEGEIETGTQEHAYLETQRCIAIPEENNNYTLYSATQSTAETQEITARVLGITSNKVTVDVRRLGGAFGGKERTAVLWACLAILAAHKTRMPVELKLNRQEDLAYTGKRHPFKAKYKVGFDNRGKITAYEIFLSSNGGAFIDLSLPILERAMFHADNAYHLPNAKITGVACKTNLPPNTAFRGFGAPQGIFAIENAIEKIARYLQLDPVFVREINLYKKGEHTHYGQEIKETPHKEIFAKMREKTQYDKLLEETAEFNRTHEFIKRGVGVVPVKFGISFTASFLNQASALLWIYVDGTISLSHGGVEMGQEINTKVAQVVARELGVDIKRIRVESSNTKRTGNASPTAASTGADMNGNAALDAARQVKARLAEIAIKLLRDKGVTAADLEHLQFVDDKIYDMRQQTVSLDFTAVVQAAYLERMDLGAHGFYATPGVYFDRVSGSGEPFYYYVFGVALAQVEVDILTGVNKLIKTQIIHETARSLNQEIDRGQIAGAFFQGFGYCTMEEDKFDAKGKYLAVMFSTYKIPSIRDFPENFTIDLYENDCKQSSVYGSKAIGEPPLIYGFAAYFAILHMLNGLAKDKKVDIELQMPATPEAILLAVEKIK